MSDRTYSTFYKLVDYKTKQKFPSRQTFKYRNLNHQPYHLTTLTTQYFYTTYDAALTTLTTQYSYTTATTIIISLIITSEDGALYFLRRRENCFVRGVKVSRPDANTCAACLLSHYVPLGLEGRTCFHCLIDI